VDEVERLEARIAELRELLAKPPELVEARLAWREAFVEFSKARGTPDEVRLNQRYLELLAEYNKLAWPYFKQAMQQGYPHIELQREVSELQVAVAALRSEPYMVPVLVDRGPLVGTSGSEMFELRPDLSVCSVIFLQTDFGPPAVAFDAPLGTDTETGGVDRVLVTFTQAQPLPLWGVTQVRFGYPNEEAFRSNPRCDPGFHGIGFYEVLNSLWSSEVRDFNRENFPETPDDLGLRHFLLAFKENTLEVLCSAFAVERLDSGSQAAALKRYFEKLR
jgi:hypothetical protein